VTFFSKNFLNETAWVRSLRLGLSFVATFRLAMDILEDQPKNFDHQPIGVLNQRKIHFLTVPCLVTLPLQKKIDWIK
jgi:hypothetical protein